jgi:hypothetical protein
MSPPTKPRVDCAVGFRVKSGYAIAVVLTGSAQAPAAVARHIVELSDRDVAKTRQPYHARFGEAEDDERGIAKLVTIIERAATRSVGALLDQWAAAPRSKTRAGLVVGSVIDPATVGNPHIRAHANEGRLFRTVLEHALTARGVACTVHVEKQLAAAARAHLALGEAEIARRLSAFGKVLGSPWRLDEKAAATAAWMALS